MYSVVLMTALTMGGEAPAWCHGCKGCWGCHGCYGCSGCYNAFSCHGCYGCGGCWSCHSCYGCGCWGCHGCGGVVIVHAAPAKPPEKKPEKKADKQTAGPNQATIVVELPEDARLYVDGQFADLPSATRSFVTPKLEAGRSYAYTLKAEVVRGGRTLTHEERVIFQAGDTARMRFDEAAFGAAPARVTVRLPEDAKLFVDGVACPLTSATRSFDTPKLEAGRKFTYTLRAELVRDGQKITENQKVLLEAGKQVNVEFKELTVVSTARR